MASESEVLTLTRLKSMNIVSRMRDKGQPRQSPTATEDVFDLVPDKTLTLIGQGPHGL